MVENVHKEIRVRRAVSALLVWVHTCEPPADAFQRISKCAAQEEDSFRTLRL